jgi:hypothetical protein
MKIRTHGPIKRGPFFPFFRQTVIGHQFHL